MEPILRWTPWRKMWAVEHVREAPANRENFIAFHQISEEEFKGWERAYDATQALPEEVDAPPDDDLDIPELVLSSPLFDDEECAVCGCTENRACYTPEKGPCGWANIEHTLCTHCAEKTWAPTRWRRTVLIGGTAIAFSMLLYAASYLIHH